MRIHELVHYESVLRIHYLMISTIHNQNEFLLAFDVLAHNLRH